MEINKLSCKTNEIFNKQIISAQINLLNKCLSKCKSCRKYEWPDTKLDMYNIQRTLLYLKEKQGLETVALSGGEPLLYTHLKELIRFTKAIDLDVLVLTTLITTDRSKLELLSEIDRLHVSLDSVNTKSYKKIRGVDSLGIVVSNLKDVQKLREENYMKKTRCSVTVSNMNVNELIEIALKCNEMNVDINFYNAHTFKELYLTKSSGEVEIFYKQLNKIIELENSNDIQIKTNAKEILDIINNKESNFNKCYIPNISCVIDSNGDVYPCCRLIDDVNYYRNQKQYSYGNIVDGHYCVEEIFEELRFVKNYPLNCDICKECYMRYFELNSYIEKLYEQKNERCYI